MRKTDMTLLKGSPLHIFSFKIASCASQILTHQFKESFVITLTAKLFKPTSIILCENLLDHLYALAYSVSILGLLSYGKEREKGSTRTFSTTSTLQPYKVIHCEAARSWSNYPL